ncbi:MAG: hypothetical protein O3C43_08845 [Verrucomicrobia bacterium]|nr:hypothetical protein [Verrucomicrobiota bacterium]MDA1066595.1 hypothetical protein [Verrucomicrobiota bacterium]
MKSGFIYTRWLLTMTFFSLMGLLAFGMMTVHSKRTIRDIAASLDRKESELAELGRRQDILDTDLASSLNPDYLKQLVALTNLQLGPPSEDRVIVVRSMDINHQGSFSTNVPDPSNPYQTRLELANNDPGENQ